MNEYVPHEVEGYQQSVEDVPIETRQQRQHDIYQERMWDGLHYGKSRYLSTAILPFQVIMYLCQLKH